MKLRERLAFPATALTSERAVRLGLAVVRLGPVLILGVLVVAMSIASPVFLTEVNLQNVGQQAAVIAIVALGQLLVIVTRGIDLSVGSALALATVCGALVANESFGNGTLVALAILATGVVVGLVNGVILVKGRVPHPFIVTLATFYVASGLALVISGGVPQPGLPPLVRTLGSDFVGPVPVPVIVVVVLATAATILTRQLKWGRWIYAVGGDPVAAERVGIPVNRVLISVYALSGLAVGFGAIVVAGRTDTGFPTAGQFLELDTIAAVIIGGASFFGGRGGVSNALVGALILAVIRNGLNLLDVSTFWQLVVIGVVVLLAVELDVLRTHLEERFRVLRAERAVRSK